MIKEEAQKITKPVKLVVFTSKNNSEESNYMIETLETYEKNSNGNLIIEEYELVSDSDLAEKYDVQETPVILLLDKEREIMRYLAVPMGAEIQPFVNSLLVFTGASNYYQGLLDKYLDKISPSTIRVMITETCAYCPTILSICTQITLASKGKIKLEIIDIMAHPDIEKKYNISTVPYIVVNDHEPLVGNVSAEQIIKQLIDEDLLI